MELRLRGSALSQVLQCTQYPPSSEMSGEEMGIGNSPPVGQSAGEVGSRPASAQGGIRASDSGRIGADQFSGAGVVASPSRVPSRNIGRVTKQPAVSAAVPLSDALKSVADQTIAFYSRNADAFWKNTRDHDVSKNIDTLLGNIEAEKPFTILDLGCGPGRDLKTFTDRGCKAIGLEGTAEFVSMATKHSQCEVWQQNLLAMQLPDAQFDGIFANAVLFHVPKSELPRVLGQLRATLKPGGVLFSSNPRGQGQESVRPGDGRFGSYHSYDAWREYMTSAGFAYIEHYYRPEGKPLAEQPWVASVWRAPLK